MVSTCVATLIRKLIFAVTHAARRNDVHVRLVAFGGRPFVAVRKTWRLRDESGAGRATQPKSWGLDKPLVVQYLVWLGRVLTGDFGETIVSETSVGKLMWERAAPTLQLAIVSFILSVLMGVPLGVVSAVKRGTLSDYASRTFALIGQAAPIFWVAIMAILLFAVTLDWLPVGTSGPRPCLVLDLDEVQVSDHAGVRAWLGTRGCVAAVDPVRDAGGAGLGVRDYGAGERREP